LPAAPPLRGVLAIDLDGGSYLHHVDLEVDMPDWSVAVQDTVVVVPIGKVRGAGGALAPPAAA
jgi:hypothetical protein